MVSQKCVTYGVFPHDKKTRAGTRFLYEKEAIEEEVARS